MKMIKICGITDKRETKYLNEAGVDYAGFVLFFPKSRRNIELGKAEEILPCLDARIRKVAVTVSPLPEQVRQIKAIGFDFVQVHGAVPDEVLSNAGIQVLRAFNVSDLSEFARYEAMENVVGYVFDAQMPGSGHVFDWSILRRLPQTEKLTFLAGGLDASNVREALATTAVDGVDASSGVERADGWGKDPDKIRRFVEAVRQSGQETSGSFGLSDR